LKLLAVLAAAGGAAALVAAAPKTADKKLTLAYTGDVWGEVGPCG
jgi:hypothetical protein